MTRRVGNSIRGRALLSLEVLEDRLLLAASQLAPVEPPAAPVPPTAAPASTDDDDDTSAKYSRSPTTQPAALPPIAPPVATAPEPAPTNPPSVAYDYSAAAHSQTTARTSSATYEDQSATLRSRQTALVGANQSRPLLAQVPAVPSVIPTPSQFVLLVGASVAHTAPALTEARLHSSSPAPRPDPLAVAEEEKRSSRLRPDDSEPQAERPPEEEPQADGKGRPALDLPGAAGGWEQAARRFLAALDSLGAAEEADRGPAWMRLALWALAVASSAVLCELVRQQVRRPGTEIEADLLRPEPWAR